MEQKYIFLDIDGVLSPQEKKDEKNFDIEHLWALLKDFQQKRDLKVLSYLAGIFCPHKVQLFKELVDKHDVKLVVHSSWTYFPGEEVTHLLLQMFKLDGALAENWSTATKEHRLKADNIRDYIQKNNVIEYIIIDDEFICQDLIRRQIMPRTQTGLNSRHFSLIKKFLSTEVSV